MDVTEMTPKRPYLLRALYDWIVDNQLTPHLVVDATTVGTKVPQQFVQDGQITLNISPSAVVGLQLLDEEVRFNARFGGKPMDVIVPMAAALALFARENGAGAMFEAEPQLDKLPDLDSVDGDVEDNGADQSSSGKDKTAKRPNLKVIK